MPSSENWEIYFIYVPIAVAQIVAIASELMTGRIQNWLTFSTFLYLLAARIIHQPWETGWFLLSILIAFVVLLGIGWIALGVGAGAAKLGVAICAGLFPISAAWISVSLVTIVCLLAATEKWHGKRGAPGSIFLALITLVVLALRH